MYAKFSFNNAILFILFGLFQTYLLSYANTTYSDEAQRQDKLKTISEARVAVENAWEVYHNAALGGTLSSPSAQSQLEMNLHKSRALLAEAYDAEEQGEKEIAESLINQIIQITNTVITGSREQKK